ncbi:HIT domain-containing protein [Streptomyces sp. SLBN-118]|uniref:TIR domain-containing protein n=1 Tax=Streptomyces sp. SLBN-118 TaxID=2768454 RepID=UPI001154DBFB|nr:TIR domain-containing protein [Streptomyces sp. SLBN-118]TQK44047.1 HIT domain-containing protein [Streptomyces sp. SLBN-118]
MTRVFIASSTEGRPFAQAVAAVLARQGVEPLLWWSQQCFPPGMTLLDSLLRLINEADGALIIATPDDRTTRRGATSYAPASNVLLEYGLFTGRLGQARVAIVTVGDPDLPSDLGGVVNLRLGSPAAYQDPSVYESVEIEPKIVPWLRTLDAVSSNGARIASLLSRLAPQAKPRDRVRLKARVLCDQLDSRAFPKLPEPQVLDILRRYALSYGREERVGHTVKTPVAGYLDLTRVTPESLDQRVLAGHLAYHVAELVNRKVMRPTLIAVSKVAATGILSAAADLLPFPAVYVSPYGPNRGNPVEGFYEKGDRAVLLHDVALSGHHLVDCMTALRSAGINARHIVALAEHDGQNEALDSLLQENGIMMHTAVKFTPGTGHHPQAVESIQPLGITGSPDPDAAPQCLLCDVLNDAETTPFRGLFGREELQSEVLARADGFVVVADVAPLTRGHVLIVPDEHALSMADLSPAALAGLEMLRRHVTSVIREGFASEVVAFEHGLCDPNLSSACGIDHAHLHVVPLDQPVAPRFRESFACRDIGSLSELPQVNEARQEYLLLIDQEGAHHFAAAQVPTSQFFRKMIAEISGELLWKWNDKFLLGDREETRARILELHRVFGAAAG